jgi:phosphoribosylaminoimidazole-succinocarboxamide synthase
MRKTKPIYEGKAKILWETDEPGRMVQEFKDDATAFNGVKHEVISGKGVLNNQISSHFFRLLEEAGVRTHFVEQISDSEMLVERLSMLALEVVVRNIAAGSLVKRLGVEQGTVFDPPIVEFYLKDDDLNDPILSEEHVRALGLASDAQVAHLKRAALTVNRVLTEFLSERNTRLVDFKLEFGTSGDEVVLGDEISPDTCRFHDAASGKIMDKDRFRQDLGGFIDAYREVLDRVSS